MFKKRNAIILTVAMTLSLAACTAPATTQEPTLAEQEEKVEEILEENQETLQNLVDQYVETTDSEEATEETTEEATEEEAADVLTESRDLTEEELQQIAQWVSNEENYGFFLSSYDDPKDADYFQVFYCGAGMDVSHTVSKEEGAQEYLKITGQDELFTDLTILRKSDIDAFLQKKAGIGVDDIELTFAYSPTYELYYNQHGDTNMMLYECSQGREDVYESGDKLHVVTLQSKFSGNDFCTAVLKVTEDGYQILNCKLNQ